VPALRDAEIALIDIDAERLGVSELMVKNLARNLGAPARIQSYLAADAATALAGADYVVNAIQVGGYEPSTVIDFEVPKKYGLRQTIGDTLGIGGTSAPSWTCPATTCNGRSPASTTRAGC
jgi:alpha-galactosidase